MINSRNAARQERIQEQRESGSVADRYPEVERIVVTMTYGHKGVKSMVRNLWFSRSSFAFFKMSCLSKDCVDGGFDLSTVITAMVRSHSRAETGELDCEGNESKSCPAHIAFEVAIDYLQ